MKTKIPKNFLRTIAQILRTTIVMVLMVLLFSQSAMAYPMFDQPYQDQALNNTDWADDDAKVQIKLDALKAKFGGKTPNIIYILTDDVGWGELGWQGGGKHRGTPSAELDKMAYEGMRFWSAYSEPSCTPSRVAINTGRHPVRTGLTAVLWPGQTEGLSPDEVTLAEVLSQAGYDTAMWGKWHLGELEEQAPERQGFDRSYYGLYNGAVDFWEYSDQFYKNSPVPTPAYPPFFDFPGEEDYKGLTGIDVSLAGYQYDVTQSLKRQPIPGYPGILGPERQEEFEKESIAQMEDYITAHTSSTSNPFFIYWPSYAQQMSGSKDFSDAKYVDRVNAQASFMAMHNDHVRRLLDNLKTTHVDNDPSKPTLAENTLVVWWSDNGPMYGFWPTSGYSWLTGAKGDVTEGGVRVPAMAWWPGMIEPGQDPVDMIHLTDLYTTGARIGEALKYIPGKREGIITDGIDQTALLLLGEEHSHRNYMFHYNGTDIGAIRYNDSKFFPTGESSGGLPELEYFNVRRDPGEKYGGLYPGLWTVTPVEMLLEKHYDLIDQYPHREPEGHEEARLTFSD